MEDAKKTKSQLIRELNELRVKIPNVPDAKSTVPGREGNTSLPFRHHDWQDIFQALGHPSVILDSTHTVLAANRAMESRTGISEEELLGKKCFEFFHSSDSFPLSCPLEKMLKSGHFETVEMEMEALDGTFLVSCTPILDDEGNIEGIIHIATEITQQKFAEEALSESEERYRNVFENTPIGIYRTTPAGDIIMVNPALMDMLGYESFEELTQRNLESEGYHPRYPREEFKSQLINDGEVKGLESVWLKKDGSSLIIRENARVVSDDEGNPVFFEGTVEDISERIRAEEELRASEEKFRTLTESSLMGTFIFLDMRFLYVNPAATRMFGYTLEEMVGEMGPLDLTFHEDHERSGDFIQNCFSGQAGGDPFLFRGVRKDGAMIHCEALARPIQYKGQPALIGTILDVTDRIKSEKKIRNYSEKLEEMVQEQTRELKDAHEQLLRKEKLTNLGQLAGGVGHELRNPLGVISNAIYYLKTIYPDAEKELLEYLDVIGEEVSNAERIVSDLLDFSRTQNVNKEIVSIAELIRHALKKNPASNSILVSLNLEDESPMAFIDRMQIGQVLINLISNAYQAMPEGGTLTIAVESSKNTVAISFADTGCGISSKNLGKIFEPLFTTKAKGIGLGLAVTKNLVKANGGHIEVESTEGQGTTFTVTLGRYIYSDE